MSRDEVMQVLHAICQEIDGVVARIDPAVHVMAVVWTSDDAGNEFAGRISTVLPEDVPEALARLSNPGVQLTETQSTPRDIPPNRN